MELVPSRGRNDLQGKLLREAAGLGDQGTVGVLLERGANVSSRDANDETALHKAAENGHEAVVRLLLERGADISAQDRHGRTALHAAAAMGHEAIVRLFIEKRVPLSTRDNDEWTPLQHAVSGGHEANVRLLLAQGAEIEAETDTGLRPLTCAVEVGHLAIAELLVASGADLNARSRRPGDQTALHQAVLFAREAIVRLLLKSGADVDAKNERGHTSLIIAVLEKNIRLVQVLLEFGADKRIKTPDGRTALDCAEGNDLISKLLEERQLLLGPVLKQTRADRLPENAAHFVHIPSAPSAEYQRDELKACKGFEAIMVDFFLEADREQRVEERASIFDLLYGRGPQAIMSEAKGKNLEGAKEKFRWFHLPANNMEWVEALVSRLFAAHMSGAALLDDQFKSNLGLTNAAGQQYRTSTVHSSFMRPMARSIKPGVHSSLGDSKADQVMLFMPFLHYETESGHERMERAISQMKGNQANKKPSTEYPGRPAWTRMARRWLSLETLRQFHIDHQVDQEDSEFVLIKRWVPEFEQDFLWRHTRELREERMTKSVRNVQKDVANHEKLASRRQKGDWSSSGEDTEIDEDSELSDKEDENTRTRGFRHKMKGFKEKVRSKFKWHKKKQYPNEPSDDRSMYLSSTGSSEGTSDSHGSGAVSERRPEKDVSEQSRDKQDAFVVVRKSFGLNSGAILPQIESGKGKRWPKEDGNESKASQHRGEYKSSGQEPESVSDGLKRVSRRKEGETKKKEGQGGGHEIGVIIDDIEEVNEDFPGPEKQGQGDRSPRARSPSVVLNIETNRHQDSREHSMTKDAIELEFDQGSKPIEKDERISSRNGGKDSLQTKEKATEDGNADLSSALKDSQPSGDMSPGPSLSTLAIGAPSIQYIKNPGLMKYLPSNDSVNSGPPRSLPKGLRGNNSPNAKGKDENSQGTAPKTIYVLERGRKESVRRKRHSAQTRSRSRRRTVRQEWFEGGLDKPGKPETSKARLKRSLFQENAMSPDELNNHLIKGYLYKSVKWKLPPLQPRRTLDEYFYTHLESTRERDRDQVVYRHTTKFSPQPKIFMVDQLWLWVLNEDTVISCCPQRWDSWEMSPTKEGSALATLKEDALNVTQSILNYLKDPTRAPIESVYDLAFTITSACASVFDQYSISDEFQFFEFFERSLGIVMDREAQCFNRFTFDLRQLHVHPLSENDARSDALFDISKETELVNEVKDIRDELNILDTILKQQLHVLEDMERIVREIRGSQSVTDKLDEKQLFRNYRVCKSHIQRVANMDIAAKRTYDALNHLLDLKQKQANASEARSARKQAQNTAIQAAHTAVQAEESAKQTKILVEQAEESAKQTKSLVIQAEQATEQAKETARQGKTVLVFTVVTIIFLPLSFMATFFAINIEELLHDENDKLPIAYVLKYMITISAALSIPFIIVAFNQDRITGVLKTLLSMVAEGLPPPVPLSRYLSTRSEIASGLKAIPHLLAVCLSRVLLAPLNALMAVIGVFRLRREKTRRGGLDGERDLTEAEEGQVNEESVRGRSRRRSRSRSRSRGRETINSLSSSVSVSF